MARKTQITKKIILQAALEILIEKGFAGVNIKTLSEKINCSTQPIVWHFDNMDGLRIALGQYALEYANSKLRPISNEGNTAFYQVGRAYINLAINEPNLFRFLYMSGDSELSLHNFDGIISDSGNDELVIALSESLHISQTNAAKYLQNTIIYTHGIAALIVAGVIKATETEILNLIDNAAKSFLLSLRSEAK